MSLQLKLFILMLNFIFLQVSVLDILVENLGRKNYGLLDDQRKGM